jgi:hypothetical protein
MTKKPSPRLGKTYTEPTMSKTIRLPVSLWDAVRAESERSGVCVNALVRDAVRAAVKPAL